MTLYMQAERATVASDILVQLDTLALEAFDNPGFLDIGFLSKLLDCGQNLSVLCVIVLIYDFVMQK